MAVIQRGFLNRGLIACPSEMRHDKIGGQNFRHLSMGMSQDYVVAVEEGATMLRIGSALFT